MRHYQPEPVFTAISMCATCYCRILESHRTFVFWHLPDDIQSAEVNGGVPSEWRPWLDKPRIPGDNEPARVAYWLDGAPHVQVHEGEDFGMWTPCFSYTITLDGMPYSMWMCRKADVENPCNEEFMKDISS